MGCCSIPTTRKIPKEDKDSGVCGIKKTNCWEQVMAFDIKQFSSEINTNVILLPTKFIVKFQNLPKQLKELHPSYV